MAHTPRHFQQEYAINAPNVLTLDTRYSKVSSIVARQIAGEYILVPIRQTTGDVESIFTLNDVGTRIWELIDGQRSLCQIKDQLAAEYEVNPDETESDLLEFIQGLESVGAVQQV